MLEFTWWPVLFTLPLPFIFWLLPRRQTRVQRALLLPSVPANLPTASKISSTHWVTKVVAILAWVALVIAASNPRYLGEPISIPNEAREMMIAVDLSGSMETKDMQINGQQVDRLVMIKSVLEDFISRRVGDRLGLILFADTAYLQAPLTFDRETVRTLLNEAVIGLVGEQTAIGDAIGLAVKRFQRKDESNKVLVLLTDGQNTAGNISPDQALELAKDDGVTIYTIGVAADSMTVQSIFGSRQINPARELDEGMLTRLAQETGGQYFRARDRESLAQIYQLLDQLQPVEGEARKMRPQTALFMYPLTVSLLLTVLLALIAILPALWARATNRFVPNQFQEDK
ncbi:vWA domain-containing protein [Alteromonas oceanisediminis]|uniref:vWA domain-containing protein n=1 Tax=Alteromonas oceanisediminis TaxID=2836180 RepID=UPI001BDB17E8|nr:VWA domain-containing protein [Alteromonas oceanisediminis]MBT0587517.1 VWA domain-containing protein [Alteromonas oceanisediminis]